mmetsp:Transcript_3317/g.7203  ORF Transcript_3317/g.7203 Transcript_3317/m.7203 type:complete len:116 (-) Transcript_3317:481-828(-)
MPRGRGPPMVAISTITNSGTAVTTNPSTTFGTPPKRTAAVGIRDKYTTDTPSPTVREGGAAAAAAAGRGNSQHNCDPGYNHEYTHVCNRKREQEDEQRRALSSSSNNNNNNNTKE